MMTMFVFSPYAVRSYSVTSFFKTLYYLFTRHGGLINIAIFGKLFAGLFVLLVRFEYYENASKDFQVLIYSTIWLIVLSVSAICCYVYLKLLWFFEWKLLLEQCRRHGAMFVIQLMSLMLCFGGVSAYTLWQMIGKVNVRVDEMEFVLMWRLLFYLTAFFRFVQRILASKLDLVEASEVLL